MIEDDGQEIGVIEIEGIAEVTETDGTVEIVGVAETAETAGIAGVVVEDS